MKKGILIGALAGGLTLGAGAVEAGDVVLVTSGAELAAAIEAANSDGTIETIRCFDEAGCDFVGTLPPYTGTQSLVVDGRNSTIDASAIIEDDVFSSFGGGPVKLMRLHIVGGKHGVYVEIPAEKTGAQRLELKRVTVREALMHGVYVNDAHYSLASVRLFISSSSFLENGFSVLNQEGVRVNETSKGMIVADVKNSYFRGNSSDGLSLNERGGGKVSATLENSHFIANGSNPPNPNDPEDGFDVDEYGPGDVRLTITNSRFNKNFDDGVDVDERQGGSIFATLDNVYATKNLDEGLVFEEEDNGDVDAEITNSTIVNNDLSRGIDLKVGQADVGEGSVLLSNTLVDDWILSGTKMTTMP